MLRPARKLERGCLYRSKFRWNSIKNPATGRLDIFFQSVKQARDVTALIWDNGLFCELAVKLAQTYRKVFYFCPWQSAFPKLNNAWIGRGLEGIEVIDSPWGPQFDEIDLFIFPDVYFGNEQVYLESIGKKVWGGRMGEEMELCRECIKKWMASQGYPVGKYAVVKGMKALREYLKTHKDQWVKVNKWRGTFETFESKDYKSVEPKLDEVEYNLGAFKEVIYFVVEENLPNKAEIGTDAWSIDGKQPTSLLAGIEIKDLSFVGIFTEYASLPKPLTQFNELSAPLLKKFGYRGFFSTECRIGRDHKPYMIDFCARLGSPPNELSQEFYLNLADIIWQGANGVMVEPEPVAKYGAEVLIHSPWADKGWQPVDFPDEIRRFVKLRNCTRINGRYYVIPQAVGLPEIGAVTGWGNTMSEAKKDCKEHAAQVTGYYIDVPVESLDKAEEEIEHANEYGLKMF